jgi:hypothetical protein
MNSWERWFFNVLSALVAATGVVYFWMKYFMTTADPFAVVNHPWQPAMLAWHVMAAPALVLIFGIVLRSHIIGKLLSSSRPSRRSGWVSLGSFGVMALSGYLVQVISDPMLLGAVIVAHVASSVVFIVVYAVHLLIGWSPVRYALFRRRAVTAETARSLS